MTDRESPKWYKDAFDDYPSFVEEMAKRDSIISDGYDLPDLDKSRSSQFKNEALLNNTFDETALRESLKDIYLNSSHKLIANNKDNVHFAKWEGTFTDWTPIEYTNMYEMTLPWDAFIYPMEREAFKASQFDHTWISIEDMANNWDVFKWMIYVFIDRKVASNFEIFIEEQFVKIRIKAPKNWYDADLPVFIWKFDTNFQRRFKTSYSELANFYKWQYPFNQLDDSSINLVKKLMLSFNLDAGSDKDRDIASTLGENLEFLLLDDTNKTLDIGKSHQSNIDYIRTRQDRSVWITICAPKFLHEYPILLPTDIVYRPYIPSIEPIDILKQNLPKRVKSDGEYPEDNVAESIETEKVRQIYIDRFDFKSDDYDGWTYVPRPIVLSDAFVNNKEPYDATRNQINSLKAALIEFVNITDDYRRIIRSGAERTQAEWTNYIININERTSRLYHEYSYYYDSRICPHPVDIDAAFKLVSDYASDMNSVGPNTVRAVPDSFTNAVDDIRSHCFMMMDRFDIAYSVNAIRDKVLWYEDGEFVGEQRFLRPVDESNFIIFEYADGRWLPTDIKVIRHFPDVYTLAYPDGSIPAPKTILKAFFFYSDTMNVREISKTPDEIIPEYDEMLSKYNNYRADYKNIFMEKFYWMAIQSLYKGLLVTGSKWEVIEYICDNMSYRRFNELFMTTMDPYFKLGLATYLKGSNTEFPFDDAIDKLNEAMTSKMELPQEDADGNTATVPWAEFSKTETYERYLAHQWVPSYFDIVEKIMDDYDFSNRLMLRPPLTFDVRKLVNTLDEAETHVKSVSNEAPDNDPLGELRKTITYIDEPEDHYNLDVESIARFEKSFGGILAGLKKMKEYVQQIDPEIYNIDTLNKFCQWVDGYAGAVTAMSEAKIAVRDDVVAHDKVAEKIDLVNIIGDMILAKTSKSGDAASVLLEDISNLVISHAELDPSELRKFVSNNNRDTNDGSLMSAMYVNGLPWSTEIMDLRTDIIATVDQISNLFADGKVWDDSVIVSYDGLVKSLYPKVEEISRLLRVYCDKNSLDYYTDDLKDACINAQETCETYIAASANYHKRLASYRTHYASIMDTRKNIESLNPTLSDYEFIDRIEAAMGNINTEIYSMWRKINNTIVDSSLMSIMSDISDWLVKLNTEKSIFDNMIDITYSTVYEGAMRSYIPTMDSISIMIGEFNEKKSMSADVPSYSRIFVPTKLEVQSPGFNYILNSIVYSPEVGAINVQDVAFDKKVRGVSVGSFYNKTFKNPQSDLVHDTIAAENDAMGLRVRCTESDVIELVDDHLLDTEIERIKSICKTIAFNASNVNPYNNISVRHAIKSIEKCIEKVNRIELLYGNNVSPACREAFMGTTNINSIMKRLNELNSKLPAFIETREKVDARSVLNLLDTLISIVSNSRGNLDDMGSFDYANFIKYGNANYDKLARFIGYGTSWSSSTELSEIIYTIQELTIFYIINRLSPDSDKNTEVISMANQLLEKTASVNNAIAATKDQSIILGKIVTMIEESLATLEGKLARDEWYKIDTIRLSNTGKGYYLGDLVALNSTDEVYIFQVIGVDHGEVTMVEPLMDYALEEKLWGYYETETIYGDGSGLSLNITSLQVAITPGNGDKGLAMFTALPRVISPEGQLVDFKADLGYRRSLVQFGDNDLISFKFENIHDLDMKYEVFVGGRQVTNFIQRHETVKNTLSPNKVDAIYLNANMVDDLRNSSIFITEDNYFIYGINGAVINDPGSGFYKGQEIFLNAGDHCLRLRVGELDGTPHKGIGSIDLVNAKPSYDREDPGGAGFVTISDDMNNIDDEFHVNTYDKLTSTGTEKNVLKSRDDEKYIEKRYPTVNGNEPVSDLRNNKFMYPEIEQVGDSIGDPDYGWMQGHRIDNSITGNSADKWEGIQDVEEVVDGITDDNVRIPPNQPVKGEYHLIARNRFCMSMSDRSIINNPIDKEVETFADLPRFPDQWPDGTVGKYIAVRFDDSHDGHRWVYKVIEMSATGAFRYDDGYIADIEWRTLNIDWMNSDWYTEHPSLRQQYQKIPYREIASWYTGVELPIKKNAQLASGEQMEYTGTVWDYVHVGESDADPSYLPNEEYVAKIKNFTTHIHNLTIDDLAVYNYTEKKWEDLHDSSMWKLDVYGDQGFSLTYLGIGDFSYDMKIYLLKKPDTQNKNQELISNANIDIATSIIDEVDIPADVIGVDTGRNLRIRKLFPYRQIVKQTLTPDKKEFVFRKAEYMHYRNEMHLQDLKLKNMDTGKFENILDTNRWEVQFKYDDYNAQAIEQGLAHSEKRINIENIAIYQPGVSFITGDVWGYDSKHALNIFGAVEANENGEIIKFTPTHIPETPDDGTFEFAIYQRSHQGSVTSAKVGIVFSSEMVEAEYDGYIHNVINPMAVLPDEVKLIPKFEITADVNYEARVELTQREYSSIADDWELNHTLVVDDYQCPENRWYALVNGYRYPVINCSTGNKTLSVQETESGTTVTFKNILKPHERIEYRTLPYPVRSVYTRRKIPKHGYLDMAGILSKPLSKAYYEFWVNGKLLDDEVSIISPTKLFFHGLTSLKNLEILEINRDSHEYFSDAFLRVSDKDNRPYPEYDLSTYLDAALEGKRLGKSFDSYTEEEQAILLEPVWKQVNRDHPEYKRYPENVDVDPDILERINLQEDLPLPETLPPETYPLMILNAPKLEGIEISQRNMDWGMFKWLPITDQELIDMMNEEWKDEIANDPYFHQHSIISNDVWYGRLLTMFDNNGNITYNPAEMLYYVADDRLLVIDNASKDIKVVDMHPNINLDI